MNNLRHGKIIKTIRFYFNFTQIEFATILGISQSALSKIEAGNLELSAEQWINLCIRFSIEPNSILTGTINNLPTKLNLNDTSFKLPVAFKKDFTATVRFIEPVINFIKKTYGEKYYQNFLITHQLQEEYFCLLSNPISYNLFELFLNELTCKGILNNFTINQVLTEIDWKELGSQEKHKIAQLNSSDEKLKYIINLFLINVSKNNAIIVNKSKTKSKTKSKRIDESIEQKYLINILESFIDSFQDQLQNPHIDFGIIINQNTWEIACG